MPTGAAQVFNLASLQPFSDADLARKLTVLLVPNLVLPMGTLLSELASKRGTYRPYGQNTTLTSSIAAGATTVPVASVQGFYPGELVVIGGVESHAIQALGSSQLLLTTGVTATGGFSLGAAVAHSDAGAALPKVVLAYDVATDATGVITYTGLASVLGAAISRSGTGVGAYYSGLFSTLDLHGLDAAAVSAMGATLVQGSIYNGLVSFG